MNTGIKINNIEINVGDVIYCYNIKDDIILPPFNNKLKDGVFDSVLIKFVQYEPLNFWTIILMPYKNNKPVVNGHYAEVAYNEAFKYYNNPKVEFFQIPPLSFLHSILNSATSIRANDISDILSIDNTIKDNKLNNYLSWDFKKGV